LLLHKTLSVGGIVRFPASTDEIGAMPTAIKQRGLRNLDEPALERQQDRTPIGARSAT
jgi:hypothetical protein